MVCPLRGHTIKMSGLLMTLANRSRRNKDGRAGKRDSYCEIGRRVGVRTNSGQSGTSRSRARRVIGLGFAHTEKESASGKNGNE